MQGQAAAVRFFYHWAKPTNSVATASLLLDDDFNPLNGNEQLLKDMPVPGTGGAFVGYAAASVTLDATNAAPGFHALYARITDGGRTRYLYAPELVEVISSLQSPTLDIARLNASQVQIGVSGLAGQTVVLLGSADVSNWLPLATNTLTGDRWVYTDTLSAGPAGLFYTAALAP